MVCDANEDSTYIRIFELPPEISDEDVIKAFEGYGEVKKLFGKR